MGVTEVPDQPQRVINPTNEGTEALLYLGIVPVGADHGGASFDLPAPLQPEFALA